MTDSLEDPVARVARTFDALADDYDQGGVEFFGPIAARLADLLDVRPGEQVLDVGCGRGAATSPVAEATGPTGGVMAVDVSPAMVEHTRRLMEASGHRHVRVEVMDARRPTLPAGSFEVVAASLVVFFLPEPQAGLSAWRELLRPGGRLGISTFGAQGDIWRAVDELFGPYLPPGLLDPRTQGPQSPFATDEGVAGLLEAAGFTEVRSLRETLSVRFDDAAHWRAWSMGTGQRAFWGHVPPDAREALFDRAAGLLEKARRGDVIVLHQDVRYTLGVNQSRPIG